jgi:hypothetical protein
MERSMEGSVDFRSLGPRAQEAIRMRAVEVVKSGMGKSKAAEVFGVAVVLFLTGFMSTVKAARNP